MGERTIHSPKKVWPLEFIYRILKRGFEQPVLNVTSKSNHFSTRCCLIFIIIILSGVNYGISQAVKRPILNISASPLSNVVTR